ncbi:GILT-like protein ZK669.3 [Battus philenor]|uniref:GILT-like protein ZK669.3 n=1 Tax=Battus philenor TaxID=42288 RepID=UPI0035CF87F0
MSLLHTFPLVSSYSQNGRLVIECHHGNEECYGNKLHACSLALVPNRTKALLFNSCMMCPKGDSPGSDDVAANTCGKIYDIDALTIKDCAKGCRGAKLLEHYSEESNRVHYEDVPYILINGKQNNEDNFMYHVCATFANPPPPCRRMFDFRKRK